jgi:small redox-active disulfide protein 2
MKKIEVFGTGCTKCKKTANLILDVLKKDGQVAGSDFEFAKVEDISEIAAAGILSTPGIRINGEFVSVGKLPKVKDVEKWVL